MSSPALGAYKNAYQLAAFPAQLLGQVMDRVIFPVHLPLPGNLQRVAQAYLRGISLVAIITIPASIVAVLLAPELIHLLLGGGTKWDDAIVAVPDLRGRSPLPDELQDQRLARPRDGHGVPPGVAAGACTRWRSSSARSSGPPFGLVWVAFGVTVAIFFNYLLMADLSLRTAPIGGGTSSCARPAALCLRSRRGGPGVPRRRSAMPRRRRRPTSPRSPPAPAAAAIALGLAWRLRPA